MRASKTIMHILIALIWNQLLLELKKTYASFDFPVHKEQENFFFVLIE